MLMALLYIYLHKSKRKNKLIHLPTIGSFAVEEFDIHVNDLNNYQIFVANSVRGILPASLI